MSNPAFRAVQTMLKLAVIICCTFYNFLLGLGSTTKTSQIQPSEHQLSYILTIIDQKRGDIKSRTNDFKVLPYYKKKENKSLKERNLNLKQWIKRALSEKADIKFTMEGKFRVSSSQVLFPVNVAEHFKELEEIEKTLNKLHQTNLIWGRV